MELPEEDKDAAEFIAALANTNWMGIYLTVLEQRYTFLTPHGAFDLPRFKPTHIPTEPQKPAFPLGKSVASSQSVRENAKEWDDGKPTSSAD